MSKRKSHDILKRRAAVGRAEIRRHSVGVININTLSGERQGLLNLKTLQNVVPNAPMAEAVCGLPHEWAVFVAALCVVPETGRQYFSHIEIQANAPYKSDRLEGVLRKELYALLESCNPKHLRGSIWIANACGESLSEVQADKIIEACGAWRDYHSHDGNYLETVTPCK